MKLDHYITVNVNQSDLELDLPKTRHQVRLTNIEREIITLLCQGVSPKEIGSRYKQYKMARKTVHYFLRRVKDKLGARTTYQACAIFGSLYQGVGDKVHASVAGTFYMARSKS